MTLPLTAARQIDLAQRSFERCQRAPEFFQTFYDGFLASDARIPPMFATTKFERQNKLLQHALGLLLIYAKRPETHLLDRLAERHGPDGLDIPAELYGLFVESLVAAVRVHDPECDETVETAWRAALGPGIRLMQGYGR